MTDKANYNSNNKNLLKCDSDDDSVKDVDDDNDEIEDNDSKKEVKMNMAMPREKILPTVLLTPPPLPPDRAAEQGHQERAHPRDAHVPGQLGDVPHQRFLPGGVPAETPEAGFQVQRVGIVRLRPIAPTGRPLLLGAQDLARTLVGC